LKKPVISTKLGLKKGSGAFNQGSKKTLQSSIRGSKKTLQSSIRGQKRPSKTQSGVKKDPLKAGFSSIPKKGAPENPEKGVVLACFTRGLQSQGRKPPCRVSFAKTAPPRTSRDLQKRKPRGSRTPKSSKLLPKEHPGGQPRPPGGKRPRLAFSERPYRTFKYPNFKGCKNFVSYNYNV